MIYHNRNFRRSLGFAIRGINDAVKFEFHMRVHIVMASLAIASAFYCKLERFEWMYLLITITLVLFAELVNTAIEAYVDLATKELLEQARIAKDVAAGAVLVTSIHAIAAGFILFIPKVL